MVSKRSKADMALMYPNASVDDHLGPERPSEGPRRSSRRIQKPGTGLRPGPEADRVWDQQWSTKRHKLNEDKKEASQGVDIAMEGLREMEDNLRNAVKRQKLAVTKSAVVTDDKASHSIETAAFVSKGRKQVPDVMPGPKADFKSSTHANAVSVRPTDEEGLPEGMNVDLLGDEDGADAYARYGTRPPAVNSDYLPLPWKGRLGYACLNTYLRSANPAVFSSRTCRIASIIEHRHPLQDPSLPEHATKNRPDKDKPADVALGRKWVEGLGLANARDIVKMIRWNDKYGIRFMRLSSEMFPFASHEEYGYKLAPFASEVLAEAGKVAGELGHRLTTHPGQFTQLGSPRAEVVRNAMRDLEYHDEMLSLLRLPDQLNKDAVMILHMGGTFGDKAATLDRFRENYKKLSSSIKARLVLENDDVGWSVHDLLPICEELNIPLVLDFHHHNIVFDAEQLREGTLDIMQLYPRIKATWDRKGITQKMHYSEPCPDAVTPKQRRKHRPRVTTLPPCPDTMDLMIEAKDKEQAVFELMRTYKLPKWDSFNDKIPYGRDDENKAAPKPPKKAARKIKQEEAEEDTKENGNMDEGATQDKIPFEEVSMGGAQNRVYWPIGMEEWLRPKKREVKKKAKTLAGEMDED